MSSPSYRLLKFVCKDKMCGKVISITSLEKQVECPECGQEFDQNALDEAQVIEDPQEINWATKEFVRRLMLKNVLPKRGTESVKVNGLSNFYCKILSPLLTKYGMEKSSGRAKLLTEMNQGDIFDCSNFGDRAFLIDPMHIPVAGFGRDITGSMTYLSQTLKIITDFNDGEERLIPIHADGDGHCLVHAVSRALVGRELFWHPLRCCLKRHFERNLSEYQELFKDFMQPEDWQAIIEESDPDFKPPEGELHGLRNIHIFGLANVLKRPIILLDSLECMKKCGDYSALFLPGFILPKECRGKDNTLNKPICIAWSSFSHNHYIPLVGVQKRPLPVLPQQLIPKVWGMSQSQVESYIESDSNGNYVIGGSRVLSENYIQRLVHAMDALFLEKNRIHPKLVADYKLYIYSDNIFLNTNIQSVIEKTRSAADGSSLYRCLNCDALSEFQIDLSLFQVGGLIYNTLLQTYDEFNSESTYRVPVNGLKCKYNPIKNEFVPDLSTTELEKCNFCHDSSVRKVLFDGTIVHQPGDEADDYHKLTSSETNEPPSKISVSEDTEQIPKTDIERLVIKISWNSKTAQESITWADFLELGGNSVQDSIKRFSSDFASKHFPRVASDVNFFMHLCDEIWNQVSQRVSEGASLNNKTDATEISQSASTTTTTKEAENQPKTTSETQKEPKFEICCIKIVSPKGQQFNLSLNKGLTYTQLQDWIAREFKIPSNNQIIKIGFPPQELEPPNDSVAKLPLKHGDRLMVEMGISRHSLNKNLLNTSAQLRSSSVQGKPYSAEDTTSAQGILWMLSVVQPDVFKKGGYIYNTAAEKVILCDMTHVTVSYFPTKRFCYSAASNGLELCVKSLGHFQISADIDDRVEAAKQGAKVAGFSKCPQMSGPSRETHVSRPFRKPITPSPEESYPLVRKGPGFSVLSSNPEPEDEMDFS